MRNHAFWTFLVGLVGALGAAPGWVQPALAQPAPAVTFTPRPPIAKGVAAFPRLAVTANDQAGQRINKALDQADARMRDTEKQCRQQSESKDQNWQRDVAVVMRGPGWVSLVASDSWECGAAYPSTMTMALAYDLSTGSPLNWERLLPKTLVQSVALDTAGDGTRIGTVSSPALTKLYMDQAKAQKLMEDDCVQALDGTTLAFSLWPDASQDAVVIQAFGLPHVIAACGADVPVPTSVLRPLGADAKLLDAIDAGHKAGGFPKQP